ncbi:MAG: SDR family oxidoreductase, partial [Candidatus Kapaibacteriota bacterium]
EKNKQKAWQVNVTLVEHLVSLAKILNAKFITFSCEHIFNGLSGPYSENDKPSPTSYLGKTKLAAENSVISSLDDFVIIRLPLVYGVSAHGKKDFVARVLEKCKENANMDFSTTYYTNPVLAEDVALGVFKIIERDLTGIFHFGGFDYLTLKSFVTKILKAFNCEKRLSDFKLLSPYSYFGLKQTYSEALLSMKFSSIVQGLLTYKYLDRQSSSDFESLMDY